MTPAQMFAACRVLAPDFALGVTFTTLPTVSRVLAWHGKRPSDLESMGAAIVFPENSDFEPKFSTLLRQALAMLSQP